MLLLVPLLLLVPAPAIMDRIIEVLRPHVAMLVLLADRHLLAAAVRSGTADTDTAEFVAHAESKNPPPAPPPSGADAVICCRLRRRKGTARAAREVMFLPTTSQIDGPFGRLVTQIRQEFIYGSVDAVVCDPQSRRDEY